METIIFIACYLLHVSTAGLGPAHASEALQVSQARVRLIAVYRPTQPYRSARDSAPLRPPLRPARNRSYRAWSADRICARKPRLPESGTPPGSPPACWRGPFLITLP